MGFEIVLASVVALGLALWVVLDERRHGARPAPQPVEVRRRRIR